MGIDIQVAMLLAGLCGGVLLYCRRRGCSVKIKSDFAHMWIKDEKDRRVLYFIKPGGHRILESAMDRRQPDRLIVPYSKVMMASYLCLDNVRTSLVFGLGGASMVKFINCNFPDTRVDIVEIDSEVLRVAKTYFHFRENSETNVILDDAAIYIDMCEKKYDVIYMDAFSGNNDDTDSNGVPNAIKNRSYYNRLRELLNPEGVIVFNINHSNHLKEDLDLIRNSFRHTMILSVPERRNLVVVASVGSKPVSIKEMCRRAAKLDGRGHYHDFTFSELPRLVFIHPDLDSDLSIMTRPFFVAS